MIRFKEWIIHFSKRLHVQAHNYFQILSTDKQLLYSILTIVAWAASTAAIIYSVLHSAPSYASGSIALPGDDSSSQLQAAGTLLKILDTGIFKWGARLFAGLCIMSSAWALKEQRFGIAVICVIGAIIFGTAPKWVQNIFDIGGNGGVFSKLENVHSPHVLVTKRKHGGSIHV